MRSSMIAALHKISVTLADRIQQISKAAIPGRTSQNKPCTNLPLKGDCNEPHRLLRQIATRSRGPGVRALARRTGQAHLREHQQGSLAAMAGAPDHADQR